MENETTLPKLTWCEKCGRFLVKSAKFTIVCACAFQLAQFKPPVDVKNGQIYWIKDEPEMTMSGDFGRFGSPFYDITMDAGSSSASSLSPDLPPAYTRAST
jgi:hypothetical protein